MNKKKFLVMTDIEGVTGITSFEAAEKSQFGRDMLMNDLLAVLEGIRDAGAEAVVYDMHTDGRNVDITKIGCPAVLGKPILPELWRGVGYTVDGLYMVGLHTMQHVEGACLAHSYLREYDRIYINGILMGEIGVEAALAGEGGIPLLFVSADDLGCREAEELIPGVTVAAVKKSLSQSCAVCLPPEASAKILREKAREAALKTSPPYKLSAPYEIRIEYSDCFYLNKMKRIHPEIFENENTVVMRGDNLLKVWSEYLIYEKEMTAE
jgi:D-amino peptidase